MKSAFDSQAKAYALNIFLPTGKVTQPSPSQILNTLVGLGENPYIRYYHPTHHGPLGPLANGDVAPPQGRHPPPPQEAAPRWRAALATSAARAGELVGGSEDLSGGDGLAKRLAHMVQQDMDDYRKGNPSFAVCVGYFSFLRCLNRRAPFFRNQVIHDQEGRF